MAFYGHLAGLAATRAIDDTICIHQRFTAIKCNSDDCPPRQSHIHSDGKELPCLLFDLPENL
jgi:hypothetical protein